MAKKSTTTKPDPEQSPDWNYETTIATIEDLITQIESGALDIAQVFDRFAVAAKHLQTCEVFLTERQQEMDVLIETLTDHPDS